MKRDKNSGNFLINVIFKLIDLESFKIALNTLAVMYCNNPEIVSKFFNRDDFDYTIIVLCKHLPKVFKICSELQFEFDLLFFKIFKSKVELLDSRKFIKKPQTLHLLSQEIRKYEIILSGNSSYDLIDQDIDKLISQNNWEQARILLSYFQNKMHTGFNDLTSLSNKIDLAESLKLSLELSLKEPKIDPEVHKIQIFHTQYVKKKCDLDKTVDERPSRNKKLLDEEEFWAEEEISDEEYIFEEEEDT